MMPSIYWKHYFYVAVEPFISHCVYTAYCNISCYAGNMPSFFLYLFCLDHPTHIIIMMIWGFSSISHSATISLNCSKNRLKFKEKKISLFHLQHTKTKRTFHGFHRFCLILYDSTHIKWVDSYKIFYFALPLGKHLTRLIEKSCHSCNLNLHKYNLHIHKHIRSKS